MPEVAWRGEAALQRAAEQRAAAGLPPVDSFEAVAREWHTKNAPTWAASHSSKIIRRLELDVFPWIGSKPVGSIRPMDLLTLLKRVEDRGAIETTHRVQQKTAGRCTAMPWPPAAPRATPAETCAAPSPPGSPSTTRR